MLFDPNLEVMKGVPPDSLENCAGDGQSSWSSAPLARADFGSTGVGEVVLAVGQGVSRSSAPAARLTTLSRDDESSVLQIIEAR